MVNCWHYLEYIIRLCVIAFGFYSILEYLFVCKVHTGIGISGFAFAITITIVLFYLYGKKTSTICI